MRNRTVEKYARIAETMLKNNYTVRQAAKVYGISKSSIHNAVTSDGFKEAKPYLYNKVRKLLDDNKADRANRGGQATKKKYEEMHNAK